MKLLLALLIVCGGSVAHAGSEPLRIAIECQGWGRTKACPAFLLGFVEHNALFLSSPRSDAQVVLYFDVNEIANNDRVLLRFVGDVPGAPPAIEIQLDLDTRGTDEEQIAALEPAFTRGAALYVAALHPEAVQIALVAVDDAPIVTPRTTAWGFEASVGGYGSWTGGSNDASSVGDYTNLSGWGNVGVSRISKRRLINVGVSASYGLNKQPHLILDDGTEISFDTDNWSVNAYASHERHLDEHWSVAGFTSAWRQDPGGQYRYGVDVNAGIEWDKYLADDPRGNQLFAAYLVGWQTDKYNLLNEIGETFASYPTQALYAGGTVRKDKIGYGLSMVASSQIDHPLRRNTLSISPFIELQLGAHVDLNLSLSVTRRELPAPDPEHLDHASFEQISRASYAEPLSGYGSFNLRFHWDRTNGQRNDRFSNI